MREILFRGKRVDNGEWIEGYYFRQYGSNEIVTADDEQYHIFPNTVGQYTGLKDNNGKKIYEGDIIKSKQDGMIGVIRFGEYQTTNSENGECHLGFSIEWYGKYSDLLRKDLGWWINLKIIGNIYDNPELLKEE